MWEHLHLGKDEDVEQVAVKEKAGTKTKAEEKEAGVEVAMPTRRALDARSGVTAQLQLRQVLVVRVLRTAAALLLASTWKEITLRDSVHRSNSSSSRPRRIPRSFKEIVTLVESLDTVRRIVA